MLRRRWLHLLTALVIIGSAVIIYQLWRPHSKLVHNFDQCVAADYPFTDDDPQVCTDPLGHRFSGPHSRSTSVAAQTDLAFDTLVISDNGPAKTERTVITNQADWQTFWQRAHAHLSFRPPLIPVDFTKREVVAVMSGQHATPGYYIKIEQVVSQGDIVLVTVKESAPPKGCVVAGSPVSPYHIIQFDRSDLPVRFNVQPKTVAANCKAP